MPDKCKSKEKEVIVSTGFLFFLPTWVSKTRPHKSEFAITDKIRQEMIRIVKANWIGPVLAIEWWKLPLNYCRNSIKTLSTAAFTKERFQCLYRGAVVEPKEIIFCVWTLPFEFFPQPCIVLSWFSHNWWNKQSFLIIYVLHYSFII